MKNQLAAWQTYLTFFRGTYLQVVVVVVVAMAQALFVLPVTFVVGYGFDQAIPSSNFSALVLCCLVLLLIKLADTDVDLWVRYYSLKITIAIARALLRHARILILDEPMNHLDRIAVTQLIHNLQQMKTTPTTLIIIHDNQVTYTADVIYYMIDGRLQTSPALVQQAYATL